MRGRREIPAEASDSDFPQGSLIFIICPVNQTAAADALRCCQACNKNQTTLRTITIGVDIE